MMTTLHLMIIIVETLTLESPIADISVTLQNEADFHCQLSIQQWNLIYLTLKI